MKEDEIIEIDENGKVHGDISGLKPQSPAVPPQQAGVSAEALAQRFHYLYESLAPQFGYETRKDSAVAWEKVPEKNRKLMIAVCEQLLATAPPEQADEYTKEMIEAMEERSKQPQAASDGAQSRSVQRRIAVQKGEPVPTFVGASAGALSAEVARLLKRVDEDAKGTRCLTMAEVTLCLKALRKLAEENAALRAEQAHG